MMTCEVNTVRAEQALNSLHDAMVGKGMDASNLVKRQARLLCRTLAKLTPPLLRGGRPAVTQEAKEAGENAIGKELNRILFGISDRQVEEARSVHVESIASKTLWTTKAGQVYGVEETFFLPDIGPAELAKFHNAARQKSTGKISRAGTRTRDVGRWRFLNRVVTRQTILNGYLQSVKARVGRWKASWAVIGADLGDDKYPGWVTRHFGKLGGISRCDRSKLDDPVKPSITMISGAPGSSRPSYKAAVRFAINLRVKAMISETKLILRDYKDWRTVRAKAATRPEPAEE